MADAQQLAEIVALAIKSEIAPLRERLTQYAAINATLAAEVVDLRERVGSLRERVAVAEAVPPVPGPAGAPGADGFTPDEITLAQDADDARVLTLGYRRGELVKSIGTIRIPAPGYCGVYDRERAYLPGDQVTHAGALWHCHAPTRAKPGDDADGWQLQVKRGQG